MATKYSNNYTLLNNVPSEKIAPSDGYGKVRALYAEYALTADLASGDVIKMFRIPKGARVIDMIVDLPDLDTSGGTVDIGWSKDLKNLGTSGGGEDADADGFKANVDVATAAIKSQLAAGSAGFGKKFAEECDFQITIDGDTDATSGTIKAVLLVVVE